MQEIIGPVLSETEVLAIMEMHANPQSRDRREAIMCQGRKGF